MTYKVFVSDLSDISAAFSINEYCVDTIKKMPSDGYQNGFTYILIPGMSEMHSYYAMETTEMPDLLNKPVFGWITGVDLNKLGTDKPKVISGLDLKFKENCALTMHVALNKGQTALIDIVNIFSQNTQSDVIQFKTSGFSCREALINGKEILLADYLEENNIDTKLPIVADYSGALINVSIQKIDDGEVFFYAPVQQGITYHIAEPVEDYIGSFQSSDLQDGQKAALVCNLNYFYSDLEDKKFENFYGPFTFGEIAYVLVNQTLVHLSIVE